MPQQTVQQRMNALLREIAGPASAWMMAVSNADMERKAVAVLRPAPRETILEIGCGPGVGLEHLARRLPAGKVIGVDPSPEMLAAARRRNSSALLAGRVQLHDAGASALPLPDASCDGAIAVNSIMLWEPLDRSLAELARVLKPGAPFVSLTHTWAFRAHGGVDGWLSETAGLFEAYGLIEDRRWRGRARTGSSLGQRFVRTADR